jgi:hypothetical protein
MSTLLEQAIIDAEALKEAAIKNAEASIIEKYSSEVKAAVESLIEQESLDPLGVLGDLEEAPEDESPVMDEVPYAVEEGDDPIMVRLDLEALERALDEEGSTVAEDTHEELAVDLEEEIAESEEEIELDEIILSAIAEELTVDVGIPDQGLGGRTTPTDRNLEGQKVQLAALKDDELAEEHAALEKARKEAGLYMEQVETFKEKTSKLQKTILHLKEQLEKTNLSNARLLYTNRVLNSTSLNERQKTKIVESISNADSVEEAKVIYETLQSAVGNSRNSKSPQSLREAVEKPSPTLPRQREAQAQNPHFDRMRALAGIKGGNK